MNNRRACSDMSHIDMICYEQLVQSAGGPHDSAASWLREEVVRHPQPPDESTTDVAEALLEAFERGFRVVFDDADYVAPRSGHPH